MNKQIIYIAIYRVLECLEKEEPNEELSGFLDEANPYVFTDRKSANLAIYSEYEEWIDKRGKELAEEDSYEVAKSFIAEKTSFEDRFAKIDKEEWEDLIHIIKSEEPQLV